MLKRIRLTDFKSFVDEEVQLAPLTLLVGANASGKSNLFDAVRFLQGTVFDLSLTDVLNGEERSRPDAWPGIRGRAQEAARIGKTSFAIDSTWMALDETAQMEDEGTRATLGYKIECRTEPSPGIISETLSGGCGQTLMEAKFLSKLAKISWGKEDPDPAPFPWSADQTILWYVLGSRLPHYPEAPSRVVHSALNLSSALQRIQFLDLQPSRMREYGSRETRMGNDGSNFSGVLADLCDEPLEKQSLVNWLAELCSPELENIDFIEVKELGDIMAVLVEKGGRRISSRSASDGTLRFLGTLLALRTAEPDSVVLIEEIEDGLHPTRIRLLMEYVEAVTRERNIQVIATTHSPVVLEWLSDEALRNVIVFGRVPEHEGTLMRRLGDLPHFDETVARTGIEELFTTGWLEMAL